MSKVKEVKDSNGSHYAWAVKCPGCSDYHLYDDRWQFNNDMEKPTFTPSYLATWGPEENRRKNVCHSFVTNGKILFQTDCTHIFAGQTVDLPEIDPMWNENR